MANWKMNPRTGMMEPTNNPEQEIANIIARVSPDNLPTFDDVRTLREGLLIANGYGYEYLIVRLNGQWRCCGVIRNKMKLLKYAQGPLVNFHRVWQQGVSI